MKFIRSAVLPALALSTQLLAGCAGVGGGPVPEVRQALAPTGKLRVGMYQGSPTSLIGDPSSSAAKGICLEVGRELARRLGVPFQPVVYRNVAEIVNAMKAGQVDMTVTNASAARARYLDFSAPVLGVGKGYLVMPGSPLASAGQIDRPGLRVGVSRGSSSLAELSHRFKHASLVQAATLKSAAAMLADKQIDAFATNKAILYKMSDGLPGSRVLDGEWGREHFAIGIPKGREAGVAYLRQFGADVTSSGLVRSAAARAGLRGIVE